MRRRRQTCPPQVLHAALEKFGGDLRYRHAAPSGAAGLWVADAVAWAYGAGGDWRRRVLPLIDNVWRREGP